MGLRIITGAAVAGKTGVVHDALEAVVSAGGTAALLLPAEPDVRQARSELATRMPIGLWVGTFDTYLDQLWVRTGDGRRIVSDTQRAMFARKAIEVARVDRLSSSAHRPGFASLIEGLVRRAAESELPIRSASVGQDAAGELLGILDAYTALLRDAGLVERARAHQILTTCLDACGLPDCIGVNRFGNLGPTQSMFIRNASTHCDVLVALTWVQGSAATRSLDEAVRELMAAGAKLEEIGISASPSDTPEEIVAIERGLSRRDDEAAPMVEASGALILSEGWGQEAEAARITREVQDALGAGVKPGDIAVVFRDPLRHHRSIVSAFRQVGIQAELDLLVPLKDTGAGRAMGQLLSFFIAGGDRRDLFGFLRTRFAPLGDVELDALDVRLRANRASGIQRMLAAVREVDGQAGHLLKQVRDLCGRGIDQAALPGWDDVVAAMLHSANPTGTSGDPWQAADLRTMQSILVAIREMAEVESVTFDAGDLLSLLRDGRIPLASTGDEGRVQVLGAERLRGRRFSCVILGGLVADEFPALSREDALTAPEVATVLHASGIDMRPRVDLEGERLLFYQVVTRARHRLVLSRCVADEDGRPLRPSPLLEEFLDLYRDPTAEGPGWYHAAPPVHVMTLQDLGVGADTPRSERRVLRTAVSAGETPGDSALADRVRHACWRNRDRSVCLGDRALERLSQREVFSASEIESYLGCPYRWYVERVLRPGSIDQELDAGMVGRAAHEVMSRFYERFRESTSEPRVTTASLAIALKIHEDVARDVERRLPVQGLSEEVRVRQVIRSTRRLVEEDVVLMPGFQPYAHEWEFGFDEEGPEAFGAFSLRGRIDRIDVGPGGFVITDYKTGSLKDRQADKFVERGLVQLPLYAEVVRRRADLGEPVGGLYRSVLSAGKPRGFYLEDALEPRSFTRTDRRTAEGIRAMIEDAIERSTTAVEGMRAGRIDRTPLSGECPSYCPARVFCEGRVR